MADSAFGFDLNFTDTPQPEQSLHRFLPVDFGTRGAERLLPLPATATLQQSQQNQQPQSGNPADPWNLPSPWPQPQPGEPVGPGPLVPVEPVFPAGQAPGPGNVDEMLTGFRSAFPMVEGGSLLTNQTRQSKAIDAFRQIVNAAGGNFDQLAAEIGLPKLLNRIGGVLGYNDLAPGTLAAGAVDIGNGLTLPFGPGAAERTAGAEATTASGQGAGGAGGSAAGPSFSGAGGAYGGGTSTTSFPLPPLPTADLSAPAAGGPSFPLQFPGAGEDQLSRQINETLGGLTTTGGITDLNAVPRPQEGIQTLSGLAAQRPGALPELSSDLFDTGAAGLQQQIQTGGFDPNLLFQVRQSLRENLESERRAALDRLDEELSRRRIGGAGIEASEVRKLDLGLEQEISRNLRDVATQMGLSAADRQLAASQSAAQIGQNDKASRLALLSEREARQLAAATGLSSAEIQQRGQDISLLQTKLTTSLTAADLATQRALGIGELGLKNLGTNLAFIETAFNQRMQLAQFVEAANQARSGNVASMVGLLLSFANALQQGRVA